MKQEQIMHRRALGLLLAASALPFTPAMAQDQPAGSTPPPIVDTTPPPVTTPVPEATTPTPLVTTPPPVVIPAPVVTTPAPTIVTETATTPTRRATRTSTTRTVTRQAVPTRSTVSTAAPAAATTGPVAAAPLAAQPAPIAELAPLPVETLPVETATTTDTGSSNGLPTWAWLLAGLGLAAIILGLLTRRRRSIVEEEVFVEEPATYAEPVRAEPVPDYQAPIVAPAMVAPAMMAASPVAATIGASDLGEPQIEFEMRPVRAGVGEDDARVEFKLGVANRGTGTARDVRVSAWMLGANSSVRSEAEDALIERVDIDAGEDASVEASVGLPRSGLGEDAIIPVVVAEATYRRPDGSEGRTTATYQVGVPDGDGDGGEMIYFDVENPSGLHGGVVAREIDELERA